ncbi:ribosome silencing factor [uncultured Merdimonas sp.]|uniref:ribosome silencing factor n=1 Tax=uncultured Merdimonas sp. TaxID=2023269 RepID=UPI0032092A37
MEQAKYMLKLLYQALEDKKGEDIVMIDISQISVLADYFIICSAGSDSQIQALMDSVEEKMHQEGFEVRQQEGRNSGTWVLMDFGDVIVHIFDRENRSFYNLERIWNDGRRVEIEELS